MNWTRRVVALALAALVISGCSLFGGGASPAKKPTATTGRTLRVQGFYDDRSEKKPGVMLDTVQRNRALISDLAPFWYKINRDGSITDMSERDVRTFSQKHGIRLLPLVTNQAGTDAFLRDPAARHKAVAGLLAILDKNARVYDGFSIDFQLLQPPTRPNLTAFMSELYPQVHKRRKLLHIDVIPTGQASNASSPYNLPALAKVSDAIVLMTYDQHSDSSLPGPVADLGWVRSRISAALKAGVRPSKLEMGVAAYGYDWIRGTTKADTVPMKQAKTMVPAAKQVRAADFSPHFTYTDNQGRPHVVWYEDERSVARKIRLAKQMGLRGIAIWHVGQADQAYWNAVRANIR